MGACGIEVAMIFKNKKISVIGLGKSGFAAAQFLIGKKAQVSVTDNSSKEEILRDARRLEKLGARVETGRHTAAALEEASLVVTSPGISKESFPLKLARQKKIPVISEVELAALNCRGFIVGITGTNGKTTTSHLIHEIISHAGRKSVLCGNIGYSFLEATREIDKKTVVVLELSSFQLEDSPDLRPDIALVLNISPNHLDRHKTLKNYTRAKENIFKNQTKTDVLILNYDDPVVKKMSEKARSRVIFFSKAPMKNGIFLKKNKIVVRERNREVRFLETRHFKLKGDHNIENILAAAAVAWVLKIPATVTQRTSDLFKTLEHRIEPLGQLGGVYFVNDSKSTTVESTKAAILSVKTPLVLIAGGRDKGVDFSSIEALVKDRVKRAILYGESRDKIKNSWKSFDRWETEADFAKAVERAFQSACPGDTVLLSPMCTSFDQFSSYAERGNAFKQIFKKLGGS